MATLRAVAALALLASARGWSRKALPGPPPHSASAISPIAAGATPLRIDVLTIPAYGHFQTTAGVAAALAARGHDVTMALCERSRADFERHNLTARGVRMRSAGACLPYDGREAVIAELIAGGGAGAAARAVDGVAALARAMCDALEPQYAELARARRLPQALVFDADSYCGMDLSLRFRVPRVARVGTGLRDAYSTPVWAPLYSSGARVAPLREPPLARLRARLANAALVALTRLVVAPLLLPRVYARDRAHWLALPLEGGARPPRAAELAGAPAYALSLDEFALRAELPWDGVPTLYNSHWGLEHPRPVAPFEHLVGHTNEFALAAEEPLPPRVAAWLDGAAHGAAESAPVVYVGLGTLSVLPRTLTAVLVEAFSNSREARFLWAGAGAGAGTADPFPPELRAASRRALCACRPGGDFAGGEEDDAEGCEGITASREACVAATAPGSIVLVGWTPQVPALVHSATAAFVTHGGMNGIAEGTFARLPLLCVGLFMDQFDNCAHAADRGAAIALDWRSMRAADVGAALARLLLDEGGAFARAGQAAWVANIAAGGMQRCVDIIEGAAALPYGSHLGAVPRHHFLPFYEAANLDIALVSLGAAAMLALACCACARKCCGCGCGCDRAGQPALKRD